MNKPLITKEQFVQTMDLMKNKDDSFVKLCDIMEELSPGFRVDFLPNSDYDGRIIFLLNLLLREEPDNSLIDYFIFELEWGKSDHASTAFTFNDQSYDLSSAEKLYDALVDINFTRATEVK